MPAFSRFLRYFVVVGRLGLIRRAAEELNVSAFAIDRQILNAEAGLGLPLFERLPTGLHLTAAGEILMAAGGRWQKNLYDVLAQIEDLRGHHNRMHPIARGGHRAGRTGGRVCAPGLSSGASGDIGIQPRAMRRDSVWRQKRSSQAVARKLRQIVAR